MLGFLLRLKYVVRTKTIYLNLKKQKEKIGNYLLRTGKCTIGYDSVLAILRVSGLSPEEQREAKLVLAKGLKDLHA